MDRKAKRNERGLRKKDPPSDRQADRTRVRKKKKERKRTSKQRKK